MKEQIKAYLTATINIYQTRIDNMAPSVAANTLKDVVIDLGGMIDYFMDFKENVQAANDDKVSQISETCFKLKAENDELLNRIANLSCSYKFAIEEKQSAMDEAMALRSMKNSDNKIMEKKDQEINKLKCSNVILGAFYREQTEKIKKLTGPQWLL